MFGSNEGSRSETCDNGDDVWRGCVDLTLIVGELEALAAATNDNARIGRMKTRYILDFALLKSIDFQNVTAEAI